MTYCSSHMSKAEHGALAVEAVAGMVGSEPGVNQEIQRSHRRETQHPDQAAVRSLHTLVEVVEGRDLGSRAVLLEEEQGRRAE